MKAYIKATRTVLFPFEQREIFGKVHYVGNVADKNRLMWKLIEEFEAEHPDFEPVEYQLVMDNSFDKENGIEESFEKYKDLINLLRTEENKEK